MSDLKPFQQKQMVGTVGSCAASFKCGLTFTSIGVNAFCTKTSYYTFGYFVKHTNYKRLTSQRDSRVKYVSEDANEKVNVVAL